jgi:phosphatidylserine decarboxylase
VKDALVVSALSVLPKHHLARGMGWFSRLKMPRWLRLRLLGWYVAHYRVDLRECVADLDAYPTLSAFFMRPLKAGVRPLATEPSAIACPADACVATTGLVTHGRIPQATCGSKKALAIDVEKMLGGDRSFEGGPFAVLYLAPPDYHRVHAPLDGRIARWSYLPGRLFPVFPTVARGVEGLFARNERLVTWFDTAAGRMALVMVGAFGVGRIELHYADVVTNNGRPSKLVAPEPQPSCSRGEEIGRFNLGSTVILLFEPGRVELSLQEGQRVKVGQSIGHVRSRSG